MNQLKNTLVILTPGFPGDEDDSVCLPMQQQLIRALKASVKNTDIIVISFQYPYHTREYNWHGIKVIPFNGRNKGGLARLLIRRKVKSKLNKIQSKATITGLLSFWYGECALVGHQFAIQYGIRHFCWILGQDARKENKYPRKARLGATELIALSDFLRDEFETNHGVKPVHLIPPGVDTRQYSQSDSQRDIDILGVGSLIPLKQYDLFIEIISAVKKKLPHVNVVLAGNGPEKYKLQRLIAVSLLESNITMTGEISYPDVLVLMQRSKILLHPSSYEGFSGVCLEALYAGAHVVSFCKAMKANIGQWHIVTGKEQMIQRTVALLGHNIPETKRILLYTMNETATKMINLFLQPV